MISKKLYSASGNTNRFLSDFIIRSDQYARPYAYIFDDSLAADGSQDTLQSTGSVWNFPNNLYRRGLDTPQSEDLVTTDKWDVVDNSVLFYSTPLANTRVWLEVATTAEEFGGTLTAPSVERAENAAEEAEGYRDTVVAAESSMSPYYDSIAAIGPEVDKVVEVADNIDDVVIVADAIEGGGTAPGAGGQFLDSGLVKGIQYMSQTVTGDATTGDITIPIGTNAFSIGSVIVADGGSIIVPSGSEYKIL